MAYANGGCGPFKPAALDVEYRALKLQSNAPAAVDVTVISAGVTQPLHLEPGELISGTMVITAGTLTSLIGYIE